MSSSIPDVEAPQETSDDTVDAKPVDFPPLSPEAGEGNHSLDRVLDIEVPLAVEVGRIKLSIEEILRLTKGSVVQLERNVTEPVDLVVQGVCIARGEIVVVDECFAVRITEIVKAPSAPTGASPVRLPPKDDAPEEN